MSLCGTYCITFTKIIVFLMREKYGHACTEYRVYTQIHAYGHVMQPPPAPTPLNPGRKTAGKCYNQYKMQAIENLIGKKGWRSEMQTGVGGGGGERGKGEGE